MIKIKPFISRLIKENIIFVFSIFFITTLIIITIKIGIEELSKYNLKTTKLKTELTKLNNQFSLVSTNVPSSEKLEEDIIFLNTAIPNFEDYFSIIYALEKLSQKSNFMITGYVVNVEKSTKEKLKIEVSGTGDTQSFITFLKEYNFGGGRLITSDKITIDPSLLGSIKIDLTFYSKNVSKGKILEGSSDFGAFKDLENLKTKVNFIFNEIVASSSPDLDYPKKSNPF